MFKNCTWIISAFMLAAFLNMVLAYRSHYFNAPAPAQARVPDDTQSEFRPDQNSRYDYDEELNGPTQADQPGSERVSSGLQQNLRAQLYSQHTNTPQFYNRNPSQESGAVQSDQEGRKYDDGVFKSRQQSNTGLGSRNQIPIVTPIPITTPSRDIVFPDEKQFLPQRRMSPRCAEPGKTFCSEVVNYPQEVVDKVLNVEAVKYEQFFGEDVLPDQFLNITQRIDAPGEESLCTSMSRIIYPQAGLTKDNNWSFIVNQPNYTQGVRIEECLSPGKPCAMTDSFPNTYTTECKQRYIYRHLVGVNDDGKVVKDLFQLPSCCSCVLKSMTRFRRGAPQKRKDDRN